MRFWTQVVRGGVWLALLLAVGYETATATSGTIVVQVWRESAGIPASGANVTIVGSQTAAITNVSGRASLTAAAGTHQVRATLVGFCNATATVVVTEGQSTGVTLVVGAMPCSGSGSSDATRGTGTGSIVGRSRVGGGGGGSTDVDRVSTGGSQPLYGLVDIRTGAAADPAPCANDSLIVGAAGVADLQANALTLSEPGVTCHGAAWVFTEDHAPWFSNTAASFPWTNGTGDVLTTTLPANRLHVPVTIWRSIPTIDPAYPATIEMDLNKANGFLKTNRTGLVLTNSETGVALPELIEVGTLLDPTTGLAPFPIIGNGCGNTSTITRSTLVYRPDHINIYVVENIDGSGAAAGRNCRENGAANVIFMKKTSGHVTLLHEIGHALALIRPHWGHADKIAGLYLENIMTTGATLDGHLSLGQIARMHADDLSWLNQGHGTPAGSVRSRQAVSSPTLVTSCGCPGNAITDDCPQLDKDISRAPAMPNGGLASPACHVEATTSCISLATGGTTTVTANGYIKSGGVTGFGEGIVSSISPTLATAVKPAVGGEGPGWVKALVTAGTTTGATELLMWIGGTGIKIPIRIGSPCT